MPKQVKRTATLTALARAVRLAAMISLAHAAQSAAAEKDHDDQAEATSPGLEVIVVTAQKTEEDLMSAALSVSATTAEDLEARQITSIGDVSTISPGISVGQQYGQNRTFIRGIGLTSFSLGADASTAFHVDGVYIARPSAQLSAFFDLDRIEVVRGPQGTLYGRNATAGSINLVTAKPTDELSGRMEVAAGNHDLAQLDAVLSGPLSSDGSTRARIAVETIDRSGYGENQLTGEAIDDADTEAARGTLVHDFSDTTTVTLSANYARENDNNFAAHFFGAYRDDVPLTGILFGGTTTTDERDIASDLPVRNDRTNKGAAMTVNWSDGDWAFNSITGYQDFERTNAHDIDGTSVDAGGGLTWTEDSQQFSQEFQLSFSKENVDGIVGLYYFDEDVDGRTFVDLGALAPGATFDENGSVTTDAWAIFAQGNYDITSNLRVTAGVRYSDETREADGTFTIFGSVFPTRGDETWSATTPKFAIEYTLADDTLLYVSATKGFKSGLFNIGSVNPPIDPEYIWAYELGAKSRLLDDRVELSAAAFFYDYTDLQVGRVVNTQLVTVNAAEAENKGVELSVRALATDNLEIYLDASWLDATFTEFDTIDAARPELGEIDLSGNNLSNSPEYTLTAGAAWTLLAGEAGSLRFNLDVNRTDRVWFTEFNDDKLSQDAVTRVNAALSFTSADERWTVSAFGKNLTDETIVANNIIASSLWGYPLIGSLEPPRTWGVRVGYHFGK